MPPIHDQGICIRHWDFSETSQTVSLFGRQRGLVRGLAKGAKRERGAFDGGIDLLSRGEFGAILRPGKELATLTEWDLLETFPRLRTDLSANRTAFLMADLVGRMLQPEDPHPVLFDRFVDALRTIGAARGDGEPAPDGATALMAFQWELLRETGYRPSIDVAEGAEVIDFSPEAGGTVLRSDASGGPRWRVRRATIDCLARTDAGLLHGADQETVTRANRLLAAYLRHVLGTEPPTMRLVFGATPMRG
jgi:DNA repair protein RecO